MLAISMGDPNGIGPEIALKSYFDGKFPEEGLLVGDISVINFCAEKLSLKVPIKKFHGIKLSKRELNVLDMGLIRAEDIVPGKISIKSGAASLEYIKKTTKMAINGEVDAIVTLPISKKAIMLSSPKFIGHTELIAEMCGVNDYAMMIASDKMITTYVSTHVSIKDCVELVRRERILKVLELTALASKSLRGSAKIAIAALNPHAGEDGAFGDEEIKEIIPAIEDAKKKGIDASGPASPDTIFFRAIRGEFDAVVCMYHDQGHIAMKFSGIDDAVNVTLGLPIVRTSVAHGTAFDIAYQGKASTKSFTNACKMALSLCESCKKNKPC